MFEIYYISDVVSLYISFYKNGQYYICIFHLIYHVFPYYKYVDLHYRFKDFIIFHYKEYLYIVIICIYHNLFNESIDGHLFPLLTTKNISV